MNKRILRSTAIIICVIVFIFSIYRLGRWLADSFDTEKQLDEIVSLNVRRDNSGSNDSKTNLPLDIDFKQLINKNADTVGWIRIANTEINSPFVQTKDNEYYLNHSFNKKTNDAGWLFLDYRNDIKAAERNNIIYGHNRKDGTMFGTLNRTLKEDWQKNSKNQTVEVSTPEGNTYWQIFSVYKSEPETYYLATNFSSDQEYQKFLNTIKGRSVYDFSVELSAGDKIITLSTCDKTTNRIVLHAKLIKSEN